MLTNDQREHIQTRFHIPVDCSHPATAWVIALDGESLDMPSDKELLQIKSYAGFTVRRRYPESAASRIIQSPPLKHPYSDLATIVFIKGWGESGNGWHYRFSRWTQGPLYVPCSSEVNFHPHSLVELMDRAEKLIPERWTDWKQNHSDFFPPTPR